MDYKQWMERTELESKILSSTEPRIAVFAAKWCGYCRKSIGLIEGYEPSTNVSEVSIIDTDSSDGSPLGWISNKYSANNYRFSTGKGDIPSKR